MLLEYRDLRVVPQPHKPEVVDQALGHQFQFYNQQSPVDLPYRPLYPG